MTKNASWFEMADVRKRRFPDAVWVPLRASETLIEEGEYGYTGYRHEFFGLGSLSVPLSKRREANKLSWSDIGISNDQGVWASRDMYKPADIYQYNTGQDFGVALALEQSFDGAEPREWHLNQDLVFALGLLREGDNWVRPREDYTVVVRLRRNSEGRPVALEIKNEFLRDYLCARGHFLRLTWYRCRTVIVADPVEVGSPQQKEERTSNDRFELRTFTLLEGGFPEGSYAVFHVGRTDIDPGEDVPVVGPETDDNVESKSWTGQRGGKKLYRIEGEAWKDEEIEPAVASLRVRGDRIPTGIVYVVDASGTTMTSEELDDEDSARWLWFRPLVIPALMKHRGTHFKWYTRETAGVSCGPGSLTHFGLNDVGLVTVYASDIAKLDAWQQRIWVGHNVGPEGGVSKELVSAQMRAIVADTKAPERIFAELIQGLDPLFTATIGSPLFRANADVGRLLESISRFRALDKDGLFALAKDIMRVLADRIDVGLLNKVAPPPPKEKWGSLKSLEKYLSTMIAPPDAHKLMGPLFGIYDLRVADAHLTKSNLEGAFKLIGVDTNCLALEQGYQLIESAAKVIWTLGDVVRRHLEGR